MSIPLDPREVLQILNTMGYRNISAQQLKEFIKDLKRFIIYENKYSNNVEEIFQNIVKKSRPTPNEPENLQLNHFNRLHISSTQTSRARSASNLVNTNENAIKTCPLSKHCTSEVLMHNQENIPKSRSIHRNPLRETNTSRTGLSASAPQVTNRRGVIPIPIPSQNEIPTPSVTSRANSATSVNRKKLIRNTPTDLYQYYQKDWDRFKKYLPGENSRAAVRMEVRRKMEHPLPPKPKVYLSVGENHKKIVTKF